MEDVELVRVGDADELRGRPVEPGGKIADLGDAQLLERRVALGSRRELTDVELVVDVDVEHVPLRLDGVDGLARQGEGNRLVTQELAGRRVDDGRAW